MGKEGEGGWETGENVTTRMCVDVNVKGGNPHFSGSLTLSRALAFQFLEVRATVRMFVSSLLSPDSHFHLSWSRTSPLGVFS